MSEQTWIIRAIEPEDAVQWRELRACRRVQRETLGMPYPSLRSAHERLSSSPEGFQALGAFIEDKLVGMSGLAPLKGRMAHVGRMGIMVRDDYTRQGIADSLMAAAVDLADNWLNLRRLELTVYTDNVPAISLYRKHGFEIEGTLRDYAYRDGEMEDVHVMARIRRSQP